MSLEAREIAGAAQRTAADPHLSVFVTANAGSGKTKTLIDRVARLLLTDARPEAILCVTYTKAAASEMQRRLFRKLGDWSVLSDEALEAELRQLDDRSYVASDLSKARALFAHALETPGGLKIQTIHAFCEKLLRRFPLEAGVSPAFQVMDDTAGAVIGKAARAELADQGMFGDDVVRDAYARLSVALDFQAFEDMLTAFEHRRHELSVFFSAVGGRDGAIGWVWDILGLPPGVAAESLTYEAAGLIDRPLWRRAAEALGRGGVKDRECADALLAAVASDPADFDLAQSALFTAKGEPATHIARTASLKSDEALREAMVAQRDALAEFVAKLRAVRIAADSIDVLTLAQAYLAAYAEAKAVRGGLDFADLIYRTQHLLRDRPAAAWVLYKLDGGIDHILLDEAQDTSPEQWAIIDALVEEFFSGDGASAPRLRRLFVVGDEKQSIYSFQGAEPRQLLQKFAFHSGRAIGAGQRMEQVELTTSWRSTTQVLSFVDAVFTPPGLTEAIRPRDEPADEPVRHHAVRPHPGCVDVWPLIEEAEVEERSAWDPVDAQPEQSSNRRLAARIATEIDALIRRGDRVWDKDKSRWRPAHPGDVMILVRRRGVLFDEIIRALKRLKVPVAGADRLALSAHIAFDDLCALARFVLYPDDDLNLAALLKSPLVGLKDDGLYRLAHGRPASLWAQLRAKATDDEDWRGALALLSQARSEAQRRRPYEFYTFILGDTCDGLSGRRRFLSRLGAEAEEAIDEFMGQVLAAERRGVHDLESLAAELTGLDIVIKREMEGDHGEVRVMTAHGAKGLEAPIVFLPETTFGGGGRNSPLLRVDDGFLWCGAAARDCPATADARKIRALLEEAEAWRLLYVALTRAQDRLVICGRVSRRDHRNPKGWWPAIHDALSHADVQGGLRRVEGGGFTFDRLGPDPEPMPPETAIETPTAALPAWSRTAPAPEAFGRYASPSDLGEDVRAPSPSPLAAAGGLGRFRRGDLIHRLLQLLPDLDAPARSEAARALLARERDLTDVQRSEMVAAALSVLEDPRFAEVFGPGSRAEVAVAGGAAALPPGLKISGRIDRLVVLEGRVLVVDFKTNRPSPARIEDADPAYLRQMAIYAAVLADVFPTHRIEAALVWTDGPKLMPVPENLLRRALADLADRP